MPMPARFEGGMVRLGGGGGIIVVEDAWRRSRLREGMAISESRHWLSLLLNFCEKFQCENSPE